MLLGSNNQEEEPITVDDPSQQDDELEPPRTSSSVGNGEANLQPGETAALRRKQQREELQQEAQYLVDHFSHSNLEALLRVTRTTMESIRRRITVSSSVSYGESSDDKKKDYKPAFKAKCVLSIPNIVMRPNLDDVQTAVNQVVQNILLVHKKVYIWGQKGRKQVILVEPDGGELAQQSKSEAVGSQMLAKPSKIQVDTPVSQATYKNFYHLVADNREVAKLVSLLSTSINSTKRMISTALGQFNKYQDLWILEREVKIKEFLEANPHQSEFEQNIIYYVGLEDTIKEEPEILTAGAIALVTGEYALFSDSFLFQLYFIFTEDFKIALCAETKAWKVAFGRAMNKRYCTMMDQILEQIDDINKRLCRPVKDLDDVRVAMAALKEIREQEIQMDMSIGPIEVRSPTCYHMHTLHCNRSRMLCSTSIRLV